MQIFSLLYKIFGDFSLFDMKFAVVIFCLLFFVCDDLIAALDNMDINSVSCKQTPEIIPNYLINIENKSNNLRRKTGVPYAAAGDFIKIQGFLMDAACLPITNALVEIWHLDTYGVNKEILPADEKDFMRHDVNFTGGGKFYTDNLGRFEFLTVMPGIDPENGIDVPQINFRITHYDFPDFYTVMFFPEQENENDALFNNVHSDLQSRLMATKYDDQTYLFNISLMIRNTYKKY